MTNAKLQALNKYVQDLKGRLQSDVPSKWAHAPVSYTAYLERELKLSNAKLDAHKLEKSGGK